MFLHIIWESRNSFYFLTVEFGWFFFVSFLKPQQVSANPEELTSLSNVDKGKESNTDISHKKSSTYNY